MAVREDFLGIFRILVGTVELILPMGCNMLQLIDFPSKKGFVTRKVSFLNTDENNVI